ncbi:MAG: MtrB/PioB family outer membrane beta-barrel protein, partial [Bacillota bacterium]
MTRTLVESRVKKTAIAIALAAAFGTAYGDDDLAQLTQPSTVVSAGVAGVSGDKKDRSLFAQYNGLRKDDAYLLLDFLYNNRDANGLWTSVEGRNLGLDTREIRARIDQQGNWKIFGEYWQLTRYYPRTINTAEQGAGTATPVVSLLPKPGTGNDIDLKQERKRATVGGEKWITPHLMFEAT